MSHEFDQHPFRFWLPWCAPFRRNLRQGAGLTPSRAGAVLRRGRGVDLIRAAAGYRRPRLRGAARRPGQGKNGQNCETRKAAEKIDAVMRKPVRLAAAKRWLPNIRSGSIGSAALTPTPRTPQAARVRPRDRPRSCGLSSRPRPRASGSRRSPQHHPTPLQQRGHQVASWDRGSPRCGSRPERVRSAPPER